jgi:type I protein arginine methyltransferase
MLQDEDRVGAFFEAISLLVKPGMNVVELGGGTGILSSFAARCGAHVTCVERNPELVNCARKFIRGNGLEDHIDVVQSDACDFVPDAKVDVVICEMLHVGLLREKQAQVITAFKQNYVRAHGPSLPVFIPEATILMAQPVQQCFDFAGYHAPVPMFQAPLLIQPRTLELAALDVYSSIAYNETIPLRFEVSQCHVMRHSGALNAIRFVTQNVLGIHMDQQRAIVWPNQCLVLPLEKSIDVQEGDRLDVAFGYEAGASIDSVTIRCA